MFGRKRLQQQYEFWRDTCIRYIVAICDVEAELEKERAKQITPHTPGEFWTDAEKQIFPYGVNSGETDAEAVRIAGLPQYGTTKQCPACGKRNLHRKFVQTPQHDHDIMRVICNHCLWGAACERPLFNHGILLMSEKGK